MNTFKRGTPFIVFGALVLSLFVSSAYSDDFPCLRLHVQIENATTRNCTLIAHPDQPSHGALLSAIPVSILAHQSQGFNMQQDAHGPDITFEYQCGRKHIVLRSQQHYCFMTPGDVVGSVEQATPGMTAEHKGISGVYGRYSVGRSGQSMWTLKYTK